MEIQRESKGPRVKYLDGGVSPSTVGIGYGRRRSSLSDPYASYSSDYSSPLMKFLRSAESKSASSPSFITPVKFEEDHVFVMDGIPMRMSKKGSREARARSTLTSSSSFNSNYAGGRFNSAPPRSSGGGIERIKPHKNRLCSFWESCETCQFGSECQFAHGKEELQRPPRSSGKNLPAIIVQPKSPPPPPLSATEEKAVSFPLPPSAMAFPTPPVQVKHIYRSAIPSSTLPSSCSDWTPQDDGIEVTLPFAEGESPSKEDVNAYIEKVLSGITSTKRLPVFVDIFPG